MSAAVTIDWNNLPRYLEIAYSMMVAMKLAPLSMTINIDGYAADLDQEIDILRIVKMQHANSTAACIIQRHPADPFTSEIETRGVLRTYEEVDCSTIETLIRHCDPQWQADVATGKVEQIWVSALGHRHGPTVEFRVDDEDVARHLKDPHIPKMTAESYYFERTKMDGVRKCQVEGDEYAMYFHLTHVSMPR